MHLRHLRHPARARVASARLPKAVVTTILALATLLIVVAPAPAQALPPSLVGEQFFAFEQDPGADEGTVDIAAVCTAQPGETVTMTYSASGVAAGPYPGTFTESGTLTGTLTTPLTGGPPDVAAFAGPVVTWTVHFTIDSPVGDVTGTKTLNLSAPLGASCMDPPAPGGDGAAAAANLSYEATIQTATGRFTDRGFATAIVSHQDASGFFSPEISTFHENFFASTGVLPVDTSGKATGGGQIVSGSNPLERVTFGFNVRKTDEGRLQGRCSVLDHATNTHVKCVTVADYQQIGNTATWEGVAEVNGVREDYRITVQDNGEPNQGVDMFSIVTESYEAGGNVTHGNVQLHKQELLP